MSKQPTGPEGFPTDSTGEEPAEESGAGYGNHAPDVAPKPSPDGAAKPDEDGE